MAAASAAAGSGGQRDTPGQREQQQPVHGKGLLVFGKEPAVTKKQFADGFSMRSKNRWLLNEGQVPIY